MASQAFPTAIEGDGLRNRRPFCMPKYIVARFVVLVQGGYAYHNSTSIGRSPSATHIFCR